MAELNDKVFDEDAIKNRRYFAPMTYETLLLTK